jgi:hypothetical protein
MNWIDGWMRRYAWWRKLRGLPEPMSPRMIEITREALRVAHENCSFINSLECDPVTGGTPKAIRIRKPVQYVRKVSAD